VDAGKGKSLLKSAIGTESFRSVSLRFLKCKKKIHQESWTCEKVLAETKAKIFFQTEETNFEPDRK
jgi:hypothetical protein